MRYISLLLIALCVLSACNAGNDMSVPSYTIEAHQAAMRAGIDPTLFTRQMYIDGKSNPGYLNPQSIQSAANVMSELMKQYHDYAKSLAAEKCGPCVDGAVAQCGAKWMQCIPVDTKVYINKVMVAA